MASCHMATAGYCTEGASRKPVVSGRRASTKAGAASLLPVMCCCQILAIRRCLCRRRSRSTSTTSRIRSTTAPGMPASKATGSHDGDEGPADGGVLGGLGPEPASFLSASMAAGACLLSASSMVRARQGEKSGPHQFAKTIQIRIEHPSVSSAPCRSVQLASRPRARLHGCAAALPLRRARCRAHRHRRRAQEGVPRACAQVAPR